MEPAKKKTPSDTTDFEREQLRFFLGQEDVANKLADLNPSIAWLPELTRMKVIESSRQLMPWLDKNFDDPEAVREVSRNLNFFDEDSADVLELLVGQKRKSLPPLLAKCWQLIVRHIRDNPRGALRSDWFEIRARIKAGDHSSEVFEEVARILRPKPRISRRISWPREASEESALKRPSDLMSVDYEVDGDLTEQEFHEVWPRDASKETEQKLLGILVGALDLALEDAIEAEVESNDGYSLSDIDVPSVAAHQQNEYRSGFLPIVRMIAESWTRLAQKDPTLALPFIHRWLLSPQKLNKRLAIFAAADKAIPKSAAADVLLTLPQGLLFLTNTSVEVFRLVRSRWAEFSETERTEIEERFSAGPPPEWFRSDAEEFVDRCRFDILAEMSRWGFQLGNSAATLLASIKSRHPQWQLRPAEQAGFHMWHGGMTYGGGDARRLEGVPVELLVDEAGNVPNEADSTKEDDWRALCESDAERALSGLEAKARVGEWPNWAWKPFLWAAKKLERPDSITLAAELLAKVPDEELLKIAYEASWWLNEAGKALREDLLWLLWDRIQAVAMRNSAEVSNA